MSSQTTVLAQSDELVVNWHVIKACNFRCAYCYAEFSNAAPEIWRDQTRSRVLLESIRALFSPDHPANPLRSALGYQALRLSVAGGEPTLLGERLVSILAHAKAIGLRTAVITNGSRPDVVLQAARCLDVLTISIDSVNAKTNLEIGRRNHKGTVLGLSDMVALVRRAREVRPEIAIKINTVVNAENADEDLSGLINAVRPERWKIMRMLPIVTEALSINRNRFDSFVDRHHALGSMITVEDNSDMVDSYIMVDPYGRFFQNSSETAGYAYSRPILEAGVEAAFRDIAFDPAKFASRYATASRRAGR